LGLKARQVCFSHSLVTSTLMPLDWNQLATRRSGWLASCSNSKCGSAPEAP
jgi:hypothetical protein